MKALGTTAIGALLAIVACGSFDETASAPTGDDDAGADAGADAPLPDACSNRTLYVSQASGNDANDGCSQERAIKTIGAALAFAAARQLDGFEVHVCGGTYAEPAIRQTTAVSVRGGYNCATWTRGKENVTRVENAAYPSKPVTWTVAGASIGREVTIDALVIVAPGAGDVPSIAMLVDDGAKPVLANLEIIGGGTKAGSGEPVASIGLDIRRGASPEVAASRVSGGTGSSTNGAGSIAVFAREGGSFDIHDSFIDAGNGSGLLGSTGVRLVNAPKSRITKSTFAYRGTAIAQSAEGAYGIYASGGELDVVESWFRGLVASCGTAKACKIGAIVADGGAKIGVHRNAIYAGDVQNTDGIPVGIGVYFGKDVEGVATSNLVHAGGVGSDLDMTVVGIDIATTKSTRIFGNTVLATGASAQGSRVGLRIGAPSGDGSGTGDNIVIGNLFVGLGVLGKDFALGLATCGGAKITDLTKNAFLNEPTTLIDVQGNDCQPGAAAIVASGIVDLRDYLKGLGSTASGNVLLRPTGCNGECIPSVTCGTPAACAGVVFAGWDDATGGLTNLESMQRLRYADTVPCAIAQADPSFTGEAAKDFFADPRTNPNAIGHHETSACAP